MRRFLCVVALVAGCSSPASTTNSTSGDPLSQQEGTLAVETIGDAAGPWPTAVVRLGNGWVIPWQDSGAIHVRFVGEDGARADRVVDRGTFVGAAATSDGYAIVVAADALMRVHFIAGAGLGDRDDLVTAPLDGKPVLAAAGDGTRVLVATTRGGEFAVEDPRPIDATLMLVSRDGARAIDLGRVAAAPTLWGDSDGFIVAGTLTVDKDGRVAPAPGRQVREARLFRAPIPAGTQPTSDRVTVDGNTWLEVDGLVGWAARDRFEVVRPDGRALVEVGADLTPGRSRALPSTTRGDAGQSWVAAAGAGRVVWAATQKNDPVFAILDAADMQPDSPVIRIAQPSSRTTVVSPGVAGVLFAWTEGGQSVRFAVEPW